MLLSALALALIAVTAAAFAWTESLKLERLPAVGPRFPESFSPVCVCPTETAKLRLRFRVTDTVDADILDAEGEVVRSLGEKRVRPGLVTFEWDGKNDEGRIVPDAPYRLRVELEDKRRTIVVPNQIFVDTVPPNVVEMQTNLLAFSPDGDRRADVVRIAYRADGPGGPLLYVGDQLAFEKPPRRARSEVRWGGRLDGTIVLPGCTASPCASGIRRAISHRVRADHRRAALHHPVVRRLSDTTQRRAHVRGRHRRREWSWRLQRLRGGKLRKVVLKDEGVGRNEVVRLGRGDVPPAATSSRRTSKARIRKNSRGSTPRS